MFLISIITIEFDGEKNVTDLSLSEDEKESPNWAPTVNMRTKLLTSPYLANDHYQR
jgi:hypothetical protein